MNAVNTLAALRFAPLVPLWLLGLLALAALIVLAPALWRRARGVWWAGIEPTTLSRFHFSFPRI